MTAQTTAQPKARTLGELLQTPEYAGRKPFDGQRRLVQDEVRDNLTRKLRSGEELFPGVVGYDDTVIPQLVNALLARQNFILLGLRGQAKSRILRAITELLDPEVPVIDGVDMPDDPLNPIGAEGQHLLEAHGMELPIRWLPRADRYVEKLATPDVTVADLIGDVDPIKAARLGTSLGDTRSMHFGLLPRANRGIFAVNELADLSPKVQVALFNILQEGDVQIKGYPIRLELDVMLVFSANPEDYTARGKIVTPLKDRIGSEIRTHYPTDVQLGMDITAQEAVKEEGVVVPPFIAELIEDIAFQAREDGRIDKLSGVSQRLPISLMELACANAERRSLVSGDAPVVRVTDVYAGLPAITGKMELEYEGELKGADNVAKDLIRKAAGAAYARSYGSADTRELEKWFDQGNVFRFPQGGDASAALKATGEVPGLSDFAAQVAGSSDDAVRVSAAEFILEGLYGRKKLSRAEELYAAPEPELKRERGGRWN
ncbi:ATP-binding protein [Deinococcus radiodurans]|jgi:Mg-chelatase subunit ChlI|uniref:Magnesium protoporphyrin chelatase, putative n=1 Tax=Deinococcus radiodurans (strain ATCC 13939 / DSM 20539 / JCM 16871 / CCUG 27074 / LMG 4051 / NBRC 15346 / NCIMB 9279 / VKM B-1422 / R1) TaxID=243230 RepID=Q9RRA0_DEIRA|nr:ATP-binding protein [Deinococcus radiodurans]AAF12129.1 magnesium protoporphyrin chelatase, putative [Deinococcus radiodurans R1 = ATCC 13939 = DSM 20539]ANC70388.1 magnesium chelatase [Deinococcus radiodurans R1 = ATCC 13939 = DSM 20539]QEM71942.1 magnesium chelatase [Deinococcus radiodurans]QIP28220.1 sigma 54-interacting transcriptional regulator [Deinococcus radiodurans]UDL01583.1 magnesium chelatase [Deinococcus radiodurans R1 = ATCC 13939 = DSM 20539]